MDRAPIAALRHIVENAQSIARYTADLDFDSFLWRIARHHVPELSVACAEALKRFE